MPSSLSRRAFLVGSGVTLAAGLLPQAAHAAVEKEGVVTGHPQAAAAGQAVLAAGGNAVDAIVAASLVAGVVAVSGTGIGGYGGHLVVAKPDGQVSAIDFNSTAPAAFTADVFKPDDSGKVKGGVNVHGWLAAGVPGVLAGLQRALDVFGTRPFSEVVQPAIGFARDGFPVTPPFAAAIRAARGQFAKGVSAAKLFLPGGEPLAAGAVYRNPELAALLKTLSDRGNVASFYSGDIAREIADAFKTNGGLVTADDLAAYRAEVVKPLALSMNGYTIHTPPPTSGGLTALQSLAALNALKWSTWDPKGVASAHARIEAQRIAWNDRLKLLGDPRHSQVPIDRLLSDDYAKESADRIAFAVKNGKLTPGTTDGRPAGGTVHLSAVDANGLMVALTLTHGESFGAQVVVDGLGLLLGHGMSRFEPRPGHPNSPGPGKRPLDNMSPTVVTRDGKPVLALGAAGGRRIVNTVFDVLAYRVGQSLTLADAVHAPRVHTEGDDRLTLEPAWPKETVDHLVAAGYAVKVGSGATLNAIERDPSTGAVTVAGR